MAHSSGMSYSGAKLLHQAVQVSSPRQNMCTPVTFCRRDSSATSVSFCRARSNVSRSRTGIMISARPVDTIWGVRSRGRSAPVRPKARYRGSHSTRVSSPSHRGGAMSIHTTSPSTEICSSPALVRAMWRPSDSRPSRRSRAKAAMVAWPHSSTSPAGVK